MLLHYKISKQPFHSPLVWGVEGRSYQLLNCWWTVNFLGCHATLPPYTEGNFLLGCALRDISKIIVLIGQLVLTSRSLLWLVKMSLGGSRRINSAPLPFTFVTWSLNYLSWISALWTTKETFRKFSSSWAPYWAIFHLKWQKRFQILKGYFSSRFLAIYCLHCA